MTPEQLAKSGSEHGEQRAFFAALRTLSAEAEEMCFAIPNGGGRASAGDKRTASIRGSHLKAEGVKAGVPDVMLAWPFNGYAGLFIEMKRQADRELERRAGKLGKNQEPWHDKLRAKGYCVVVCYSWQEAIAAVRTYFTASTHTV